LLELELEVVLDELLELDDVRDELLELELEGVLELLDDVGITCLFLKATTAH
jgi:hypothetical protein